MSHTITLYEGCEDIEIVLPAKRIVCPRCKGEGTHTNPSIGAFSPDEEWVDDDFIDGYLNGVYDVTCERCHGTNVVLEVDEDACNPEQLETWRDHEQERHDTDAIYRMETMMGA